MRRSPAEPSRRLTPGSALACRREAVDPARVVHGEPELVYGHDLAVEAEHRDLHDRHADLPERLDEGHALLELDVEPAALAQAAEPGLAQRWTFTEPATGSSDVRLGPRPPASRPPIRARASAAAPASGRRLPDPSP